FYACATVFLQIGRLLQSTFNTNSPERPIRFLPLRREHPVSADIPSRFQRQPDREGGRLLQNLVISTATGPPSLTKNRTFLANYRDVKPGVCSFWNLGDHPGPAREFPRFTYTASGTTVLYVQVSKTHRFVSRR